MTVDRLQAELGQSPGLVGQLITPLLRECYRRAGEILDQYVSEKRDPRRSAAAVVGEPLLLPSGQFSGHAAGDRLRHGDIVGENAAFADEVGIEIGDHEIVGFSVVDRLDALDFRPSGNRVEPIARFQLFRHPPANARDPKQVPGGRNDLFLLGVDGKQLLMARGNVQNGFESELARQRTLRENPITDSNIFNRHLPVERPDVRSAGKARAVPRTGSHGRLGTEGYDR